MKEFISIAKLIGHPALILVGLALWLVFGFYKLIVQSGLLQQVSKAKSGELLHKLMHYAFWLGLVLIVLGFSGFVLTLFFSSS